MSSPAWYGRTSLKAIPRPLKTEWYWPARSAETTWRVAISSRRMRRMSSRGSIATSQGTSTLSKTRCTTCSGVSSSASAS